MTFDPEKVSYRQLLEFFYKMHDPTTANRQGPDVGTQYRSGIYYHDEEQARIARDVTERVQREWWKDGKVSTEIAPVGEWWDAEAYHQKYLDVVRVFILCVFITDLVEGEHEANISCRILVVMSVLHSKCYSSS